MSKQKILICALIILTLVLSCTSKENITGGAAITESEIYENTATANATAEEAAQINIENTTEGTEQLTEQKTEPVSNETFLASKQSVEEFKLSPESIVSTQNNISLSIDSIKHEIKSEYWGKIVEITSTLLNKGAKAFKPKLLVLLYDEKDFKEEWLKPKAEIEFDIAQLNPGEHITRQAIVSISFDDIGLAKNFKLVLVDAADPGNKPLVVAEKEFNPLI